LKRGNVRIIGGRWRGRRIDIPPHARPTSDRIRETLFNWLQMHIVDANILDCFAGSGALGFEALSRGAKCVMFIDENQDVIIHLQATKNLFDAEEAKIIQAKFPSNSFWKTLHGQQFDIVFLDPPFHKNLVLPVLSGLQQHQLLNENAKVYIEVEHDFDLASKLTDWKILKQQIAGQVGYYLITNE